MNSWNQDSYISAWNYASRVHNGQLLPSSKIPYINHLGLVAMEAMNVVANSDIDNSDLLVLCAVLHDTIEDTEATFDDIRDQFGIEVANGVQALSKNPKLASKKEQMLDSLVRIKTEPVEVWMVKLCDRITNLQPPPSHWNKEKIKNYKDEAIQILNELGESNRYLAIRLKKKIDNYQRYE